MKYLNQLLIILSISLIGEMLKYLLPLPVPASIYGMVIFFICLIRRIIKIDYIKETGKFMIEIMPVMFIPAGVGLINGWSVLKFMFLPVCLVTIITLITVIGATGRISQRIIKKEKKELNE